MALHYLIDGYNAVHHCPELRALTRDDFEAARDALVEKAAQFCTVAPDKVTIVFDGRSRQAEPHRPHEGYLRLSVVYSPAHQTADAFIERQVFAAPNRRDVVVVTGDRGIRDHSYGLGALVMSPANFFQTLSETLGNARHARAAKQTPARDTIEDRLDEAALRNLEELKARLLQK